MLLKEKYHNITAKLLIVQDEVCDLPEVVNVLLVIAQQSAKQQLFILQDLVAIILWVEGFQLPVCTPLAATGATGADSLRAF